MNFFRLATGALIACLGFAGVSGLAQKDTPPGADNPVLLELFTSQGCSSCPPADRVAAKLAGEPGLIVVSRPVTYWDRLGWKDTLAKQGNTDLQRAYARRGLVGRNGVYTPQMVVDGIAGVVGSREAAVRTLASRAAIGDTAAIRSRKDAAGNVVVGLGGTTEGTAELMLLAIDGEESVQIARGENGGRTIRYTNVLRAETKIADWSGGKQALTIPSSDLLVAKADRYFLVLREPGGGKVLAAHRIAG